MSFSISARNNNEYIPIPVNPVTWNASYTWVYFLTESSFEKVVWCLDRIQRPHYLPWDISWKRSRRQVIDWLNIDTLLSTLDEVINSPERIDYHWSIYSELLSRLEELEKLWILARTWVNEQITIWTWYFNSHLCRTERYTWSRNIPKYRLNYEWILRMFFTWNSPNIEEVLSLLNQEQRATLYKLWYNSIVNQWIYSDEIAKRLAQTMRNIWGWKNISTKYSKVIYWKVTNWCAMENKYTIPDINIS